MTGRLARHASVEAMLKQLQPSYPILCIRPAVLRQRVQAFLAGFPGTVLYAVKCNPLPAVLRALAAAGIRHFDTASLPEIAQVAEAFSDATAYFHHPVKSAAAIRNAYEVYGVRHFVIDHGAELDKLARTLPGRELAVLVRFATAAGLALFDLSAKFGATPKDAALLLAEVARRGYRPGLAFHVGSQCLHPQAYDLALRLAETIVDDAGVKPEILDVGGGFPANYPGSGAPPLADYFAAIRAGLKRPDLAPGAVVLGEPGRALVADGCSLILQVQLVKGDGLYVNDGIYGCLADLALTPSLNPPARLLRLDGRPLGEMRDFRLFGPTCDSLDVLPRPFRLPADAREGDWIEIGQMGAYSMALMSRFNGFGVDAIVELTDAPFGELAGSP